VGRFVLLSHAGRALERSNLRLADGLPLVAQQSGSMSLRVRGDRFYPAASHEWRLVVCGGQGNHHDPSEIFSPFTSPNLLQSTSC